jgi:hypothetical protein
MRDFILEYRGDKDVKIHEENDDFVIIVTQGTKELYLLILLFLLYL